MFRYLEQAGFTALTAVSSPSRWTDPTAARERYRGHDVVDRTQRVTLDIDIHRGEAAMEFGIRDWPVLPLLSEVPGLQRVHRVGVLPDGAVFVASAGPTVDLIEVLRARGPIPLAEGLALLARLADAIGAAHAIGAIHGEIGLARVLLPRVDSPLSEGELAGFGRPRRHPLRMFGQEQVMPPEYPPEVSAESLRTPAADVSGLLGMLRALTHSAQLLPPEVESLLAEGLGLSVPALATRLREAALLAGAPVPPPVRRRPYARPTADTTHRGRAQGPPSPSWPWTLHRRSLRVSIPEGWELTEQITAVSPLSTAVLSARDVVVAVCEEGRGDGAVIPGPGWEPGVARLRLADGAPAVRSMLEDAAGRHCRTTARPRPSREIEVHSLLGDGRERVVVAYLDEIALEVSARDQGGVRMPVPHGWRVDEQLLLQDPADGSRVLARLIRLPTRSTDLVDLERRAVAHGRRYTWAETIWSDIRRTASGMAVVCRIDWRPPMSGPLTTIRAVSQVGPQHALVVEGDVQALASDREPAAAFMALVCGIQVRDLDHDGEGGPGRELPPDARAAAAEFLDAVSSPHPGIDFTADPDLIPREMWAREPDEYESEVQWQAVPSTVSLSELRHLEAGLGLRLPSWYAALLTDRHFGPLRLWDIEVIDPLLPGRWRESLHERANELREGRLRFAEVDLGEWDAGSGRRRGTLSYRWDPSAIAAEDAPVWIESGNDAFPAFSSGAAMLRCLARLAGCASRPTSTPQAMDFFLSGDPRPAPFWRAVARGERPVAAP